MVQEGWGTQVAGAGTAEAEGVGSGVRLGVGWVAGSRGQQVGMLVERGWGDWEAEGLGVG